MRILGWVRRLLRLDRIITPVGPVLMELTPEDFVQGELFYSGAYEPRTLARFDELIGLSRGFADFGAHLGLYTLRGAHCLASRSGRVIAIEPTPAHAAGLLRNAALNDLRNIELYTAAFSNRPGFCRMIAPHTANTGGSRLDDCRSPDLRSCAIHVPVHSSKEIAHALSEQNVDLIKLDIEGHEFHVLQDLLPALTVLPKNIILECDPSVFEYGDLGAQLGWLDRLGYDLLDVNGTPWQVASPLCEHNLWARLRA